MGFLLPSVPAQHTEGRRLEEKTITDSAFGQVRTLAFGTARLTSNIIWASPIEEVKAVEYYSSGGKGGGGGKKSSKTTYEYFVSLALAFAEGPAVDVLRLWVDGKVVYDAVSNDVQPMDNLVYRFYPGSEDQEPDPLITDAEGATAPAFRGTCYIVFEKFPLSDFGNRIPAITAEINFAQGQTGAIIVEPNNTGEMSGPIFVDYARDRMYSGERQGGSVNDDFIKVFAWSSKTHLYDIDFDLPLHLQGLDLNTGYLFCTDTGSSNYVVDPFTKAPVNQFIRRTSVSGIMLSGPVGIANPMVFIGQVGSNSGSFLSFIDAAIGETGLPVNIDNSGSGFWAPLSAPRAVSRPVQDINDPTTGYMGCVNATELALYSVKLGRKNTYYSATDIEGSPYPNVNAATAATALIASFSPADLGATSFNLFTCALEIDPASRSLIHLLNTNVGSKMIKVNIDTGALEWVISVPSIVTGGGGPSNTRLRGTWYVYTAAGRIIRVNLSTGELDSRFPTGTTYATNSGAANWWDEFTNSLWAPEDEVYPMVLNQIRLSGSGGSPAAVSDIVTTICAKCGLPASRIDVTALDAYEVAGYFIDDTTDAAAAIEPLALMFQFVPVERDGKLVFQSKNRGNTPSATVSYSQALRVGDAEVYSETIVQDKELPVSVAINFIDPATDYQKNTVDASRTRAPYPSTASDNVEDFSLPVVLNASEAKKIAEVLLYGAWLERRQLNIQLPPDYLRLDAGDFINVILQDGSTYSGLIMKAATGLDFSTKYNLSQYASSVLVSYADAMVVEPIRSVPGLSVPAVALFLDIPLLRDADATSNVGSRGYWAALVYSNANQWPGAELYSSNDAGVSYSFFDETLASPAWGYTISSLSAQPLGEMFRFNYDAYVDIGIVTGFDQFSSAEELQVLNGANAIALVNADRSRVEILQFQEVTVINAGTLRLSKLLRGIRGTDVFATETWTSGATAVLLTSSAINGLVTAVDQLGVSKTYKSVTYGTLIEDGLVQDFTYTGRDLMPYAPLHHSATASGANVNLAWVRRGRLLGELRDGTDTVPLSESSTEYELELFDALGTTLVRTVLGLTSPAYTYLAADQVTDGLDAETALYVKVYQVSEAVGRGFSHKVLVEIE
jgi:hypothetical protein